MRPVPARWSQIAFAAIGGGILVTLALMRAFGVKRVVMTHDGPGLWPVFDFGTRMRAVQGGAEVSLGERFDGMRKRGEVLREAAGLKVEMIQASGNRGSQIVANGA